RRRSVLTSRPGIGSWGEDARLAEPSTRSTCARSTGTATPQYRASSPHCRAGHADRTLRSQNSCAYRGRASPTKCMRSIAGKRLADDRDRPTRAAGSGENPASCPPPAAFPPLATPIFFGLALHRWRCRILDLKPVIDPSRAVRRAAPLRDNAFATKRASVLVDAGAVADEVLIECDAVALSGQQIGQDTLAFLERCMTQVFAVQ